MGLSDAILIWLRAAGPHSTIYRSRAREVTIQTQSGYIRSDSLAAHAINRSGRGSCAAYIALLYERPPYSESGASLRDGMRYCRAVLDSEFRIPHSEFRLPIPAQRMINRIDEERQLVYAERFFSDLEDFEHKI